MGVAEIIGFAVCWLAVASLMLWGVFTEHKRGGPPADLSAEWHPSRTTRAAPTDWVVVESTEGGSQEVAEQAMLVAAALLASRGIDIESVPPAEAFAVFVTEPLSRSACVIEYDAVHVTDSPGSRKVS